MNIDLAALSTLLRGKFLVFDGPDGCGKSTQGRLLAERLRAASQEVVTCRDPGGTPIGDRIRSVLLDHDLSNMDASCETMLFMASRAQLVADIIRPALKAGHTVVCDRFATSTCAYQGAAGYDPRRVIDLARFAIDDCWPDVTVVLDIPPETGFQRVGRTSQHAGKNRSKAQKKSQALSESMLFPDVQPDAMEARSIEFHRRVRELFLEVHTYYPTPVVIVDADASEADVFGRIIEELTRAFG